MRNLEGKVAIITGASRGIGSAIARQLSALGAKVVVNYSNNEVKAEEVVEEITKSGEQAVAIKADVSNIKDVERLFSETITKFGKVDILVNNAGVILYKLLSDVTEEEFDKLFNINVKGTYFACQQAMKHMENNGRIINFSTSVVGSMFPTYSVYAATKGAVEQITRQLAKEFGPKKITINAVAPGPINTELFNVGKTDEQIEAIRQMNSFGRIGEPDDIANAIEFLVSDKAQWITGQTLRINGGYV
ncbi:SDR family oxidoreductase [Clostridium beijerinckii]|uniref:SDR family oxidoreductase n=1 Tax=Clostridium beijerinckii TaxID=1520 RepID=UPI00098CC3CB|nr:SDR family oxidoreductase [Clostridium beijerinckii]NOW89871.1 3-oxoacyl-[acyl-carrier protein] reductase [Clostridium beijerinckii]NRT79790.1 3-oxoacyl-[acyl-carrier protein] reductase [Clostridium beijerinckii]OOM49181.1 3-oxoacyl-[acyl-carrier-protein] reductase FabG [Clostridium beijerinckii]